MRKFVPYSILYTYIFYLEMLELGKATFLLKHFKSI
jgi:hypothetical protein